MARAVESGARETTAGHTGSERENCKEEEHKPGSWEGGKYKSRRKVQ